MATNYSLWSIPAYQFLGIATYTYGMQYLERAAPNVKWDKINNRSAANAKAFEKVLPKKVYQKWERCTSAQANMTENMAFFIGAVLAGYVTKLDAKFMNNTTGLYLLTRVAYVIIYTHFGEVPVAYLRPVSWWSGMITLFTIYFKAANKAISS